MHNRFERGDQKYAHVLDGDGYVTSFSFSQEGKVHFRSAYVRTRHVSAALQWCSRSIRIKLAGGAIHGHTLHYEV